MKTLPPQTRTVALTLILFFASSFILPLFNQSILSGIVSPSIFFITWIQCLGTVIITLLVAKLFNKQNKHDLPLVFPKFNKKQMFQMLPSSACFCCLLVFQNYSFQNDKSLLMMVRSIIPLLFLVNNNFLFEFSKPNKSFFKKSMLPRLIVFLFKAP
ncbi:nucleotide sugar transporter family [Anaeramoeba flamelloides]|uniref:Nucleotide sugar transporter family n=1 Tax=Anaeramoeba flamelloides TaxID=1746091 RepID=A0AAV7Y409_9EUKA|nr:nucleotide sugar transporter family [Anaeramoeba flamelloides]